MFITAFVEPSRRDRFLEFLARPKTRGKFREELFHRKSRFLLQKFLTPVTGHQRNASELYSILKKMGSPNVCWVIGGQFDAQEIVLKQALEQVEDGVIISCLPGELAYFKSEDEEFIIHAVGCLAHVPQPRRS